MKKSLILLSILLLLGAGCARNVTKSPEEQSVYGTSRFGSDINSTEPEHEGGWVRLRYAPFWWDSIETAPGTFDWSLADEEVRIWNEKDQAILATVWPFAQWDQEKCHADDPKGPNPFADEQVWLSSVCHVESYERFFSTLVERYDGDGIDDMPGLTHPIKYWEIGNEPDFQTSDVSYFQSGPNAYAELLQLAAQAIRKADPEAKIVIAGQSSMQANGTSFFRTVLTLARDSFDIGNIHFVAAEEGFFSDKYQSFYEGLGFENRPFWVTEMFVDDPDPTIQLTEDEAARATFVAYVQAFGDGAERIFDATSAHATSAPSVQEQQVRALLIEHIDYFDQAQRVGEHATLFTIDDRLIFALWNDATLPGDYKGERFEVLRYNGVRETLDAESIKGDTPMLVFVE